MLALSTYPQSKLSEDLKKELNVVSEPIMAEKSFRIQRWHFRACHAHVVCSVPPSAVSPDLWATLQLPEVFYSPPEAWGFPRRLLGVGS